MTFAQIYAEVERLRFTGQATVAKTYVNQAEAVFWNAADWVFKRLPAVNLPVVSGAASEPTDFGKAIRLYDPRGSEVPYVNPDDFEATYTMPVPVPTGFAEAYTVINRQIFVGPGETGTFKLSYRRRYTHLNNAALLVPGVMVADDDTPLWDSEFHYVLVPLAIVCGSRLERDPVAQVYKAEADELIAAAIDELTSGTEQLVELWGDG